MTGREYGSVVCSLRDHRRKIQTQAWDFILFLNVCFEFRTTLSCCNTPLLSGASGKIDITKKQVIIR